MHVNSKAALTNISGNIGFEVITVVVMKNSVFWDIMMYSQVNVHCAWLLHASLLFGLFIDPESRATCSSRSSLDVHLTTWLYIPEYRTSHFHEM
jgi:hypothetical protein